MLVTGGHRLSPKLQYFITRVIVTIGPRTYDRYLKKSEMDTERDATFHGLQAYILGAIPQKISEMCAAESAVPLAA